MSNNIITDENIVMQDGKRFYCTMSDRSPKMPYRLEKTINEKFAYVIDRDGFMWIKNKVRYDKPLRDYGDCYEDCCKRSCFTYVIGVEGFDAYLDAKKYMREHLCKELDDAYDKILKRYDMMYMEEYLKEQEESND